MLASRASMIILAKGWLWFSKNSRVKLGTPFSVLLYAMPRRSNATATDCAAQISILTPACSFISRKSWLSRVRILSINRPHLSRSNRMPRRVISSSTGKTAVSMSNIDSTSSWRILILKCCQSLSVNAASCSAYSPTYIAGSFQSSFLGWTPKSEAACLRPCSLLVSLR